jgi:hypothetical protein
MLRALRIEPRRLRARAIPHERGDRLVERGPEGTGIELDQDLSFPNLVPFTDGEPGDHAADLRPDGRRLKGLDGSHRGQHERHGLLGRAGDPNRHADIASRLLLGAPGGGAHEDED